MEIKKFKIQKEVELTLECTVEQRSEQTLRLNIHVSKATRAYLCSLGAHQVQMENLAGKCLCSCRLLRT